MIVGPDVVRGGLILHLDAGSPRSYTGSGTTWTDLSGNDRNLTLVNSPTFTSVNGGSIVFDGLNHYANRPSAIGSSGFDPFSMAAWIYPSNINQNGGIVHNGRETGSTGDGCSMMISDGFGNTGNKLTILNNGRGFIQTNYTFPAANAWYHVVVTKSASDNYRSYVNGIERSNTNSSTPSNQTSNFSVGSLDPLNGLTGNRFNGRIPIVHYYNRALSATEVLQNYNAQRARFGL